MIINQITDKTAFGNITQTRELFETMLLKNFKSESTNAIKTVREDLFPNSKFVGCRGYRYYAIQIKDAVISKYPEIAKDYKEISEYIRKNPNIKSNKLAEYIEPYIQKYGEKIDINI